VTAATLDLTELIREVRKALSEAGEMYRDAREEREIVRGMLPRVLPDPLPLGEKRYFGVAPFRFEDGRPGLTLGLYRMVEVDGKEKSQWVYQPWDFTAAGARGILKLIQDAVEKIEAEDIP
jgi:hypothetical protein